MIHSQVHNDGAVRHCHGHGEPVISIVYIIITVIIIITIVIIIIMMIICSKYIVFKDSAATGSVAVDTSRTILVNPTLL